MGDPQAPPYATSSRVDLDDRTCPHCRVLLTIRTILVPGHDTLRDARCPACDRIVATEQAWQLEAFVRKISQTIDALWALRQAPR